MFEKLESAFVGGRPYIQGSQMVSNSTSFIRRNNPTKTIVLNQAKFIKTTDKEVFISSTKSLNLTELGSLDYSIDNKNNSFHLYCNEDIVQRHKDSQDSNIVFLEVDKLNAVVSFNDSATNLDSILRSIISASKKLHSDLSSQTRDVWFTGFRGAEINTDSDMLPKSGRIHFKHLLTIGKEQFQTLSDVWISDDETVNDIPKFKLMFAYKK